MKKVAMFSLSACLSIVGLWLADAGEAHAGLGIGMGNPCDSKERCTKEAGGDQCISSLSQSCRETSDGCESCVGGIVWG